MITICESYAVIAFDSGEDPHDAVKKLEICGKISRNPTPSSPSADSAEKFCANIARLGHDSVFEHHSVTVYVCCDRTVAQQWTRHRMASYTMESQRHIEPKAHFEFIDPHFENAEEAMPIFVSSCEAAVKSYLALRSVGVPKEDARSVLPGSIKTSFYTTANLRQWRHFFKERCHPAAQHTIRKLALMLLREFRTKYPSVFSDLNDYL